MQNGRDYIFKIQQWMYRGTIVNANGPSWSIYASINIIASTYNVPKIKNIEVQNEAKTRYPDQQTKCKLDIQGTTTNARRYNMIKIQKYALKICWPLMMILVLKKNTQV